jgi:hypothetical protein
MTPNNRLKRAECPMSALARQEMHSFTLCVLLAVAGIARASAADAETVYNHQSGPRGDLDNVAHEHFGARYKVVDFGDDRNWIFPKGLWKPAPNPPVHVRGRCMSGQALVIYVISSKGLVLDPYAVKATHAAIADSATRVMSERRFTPGRLDGREVSSIAATNLRFACPAEPNSSEAGELAGLWKFEDKAVWISIDKDGSAFQCRLAGDTPISSRGTLGKDGAIAWQNLWGIEPVRLERGRLVISGSPGETSYYRSEGLISPRCSTPSAY